MLLRKASVLKTSAPTDHCCAQMDINHLTIILIVKHFYQKHPLLTGTALHPDAFSESRAEEKHFSASGARHSLTDQSTSAMTQKQEQVTRFHI